MIQGQNIVCIANSNWFGNYAKSTVQILERLARTNNVLFVEYPYTISDLIKGGDTIPKKRLLGIEKRLQKFKTDSDTSVYDLVVPPVLPVYFLKNEKLFKWFFALNTFIYKREVKKAIRKLNFGNPVLITAFNPFYGLAMNGNLGEKIHIYYCYDGVEAGFFGQRIFKFEEEFSKKAKAIITTSDFLLTSKLSLNPSCYVVKNGVDFPAFSAHAKTDVHKRTRKRVGYIGTLDPRFDIDTVEYAISRLTDFDFEFTGDMRNETLRNHLSKYPNVFFYQPVKPKEVPSLLARYDVGIIPYLVNDVNKNIYPLKINEYLAVGVPVVMNAFAVLPEFENVVSIAEDKFEFVKKLKFEVTTDNNQKISARIDFASQNSWEARAVQFGEIIKQLI